jgi:FHS family glucose/mannose:H+ symporter-like MFS transporter
MYKRNLVFAAACLGMLLFGVVFLSLGSVVNLLQAKFNLDNNSLGTLTALLPFGILGGSLVFGPVVDRYGYKTLLIIAALLVMLGLEGIALSKSINWVRLFIVVIGFGGGILNGGTNALVADISAGKRGANLSLLGVFFGLGALAMPGILAALSKHCSQESIVAGVGLFVLAPLAYFLAIGFPSPKQPQGLSLKGIWRMLSEPMLWLMGLILFFQSGLEGTTNDWSPRYLKQFLHASDQAALFGLTLQVSALTLTRLILGGILRIVSSARILYASFACAMLGAAMVSFSTTYGMAVVGMVLLGIGYAACFPIILSFIGDRFPAACGTAFSIAFVFALFGNMTINKTMGRVAQDHGIGQFSTVLLASLTLIILLTRIAVWQFKKSAAQAAATTAAQTPQLPINPPVQ